MDNKLKRRILKTIFKSTQKATWDSLKSAENVVDMITENRKRGLRPAMFLLVTRWADVCGISPIKLFRMIKDDEILDSELSLIEEQEGKTIINRDKVKITDSTYVCTFLAGKLGLLREPAHHISNHRIYDEIFDIIHSSYLSVYNEKQKMGPKNWVVKKDALHSIARNYHMDSKLYPNMINTMVEAGYKSFFKKISRNDKLKSILMNHSSADNKFSLIDYDAAIIP